MKTDKKYYVGTAGWNIPTVHRSLFPLTGAHIERYAQLFNCVEINSSFYRIHKTETFEKWAAMVPEDFRFSVKFFKELTHVKKLNVSTEDIRNALEGPLALKEKLGALLIQLAPSHGFEIEIARPFFDKIRELYSGPMAFEPRHPDWISAEAIKVLREFHISLVFADPRRVQILQESLYEMGGFWYARLHGSPHIYKSKYTEEALKDYAKAYRLLKNCPTIWCIFDNTTYGHATLDALELKKMTYEPMETL